MLLRLLILVAVVPLVLWAALPVLSAGSSTAQLSSKIDSKRRQIAKKKGRERVLSGTVARYGRRIGALQSDITDLQRRQVAIQADLDVKRAELDRIQESLRHERIRLARLRARLAEARIALSSRLVELYKADKPDVLTVVLDSHGFADLLERTEFMQRVSDQDARIIALVRAARGEATRTARRLDGLQRRQTRVTAAIQARRDEVAAVRGRLVDRRQDFAAVRDTKAAALASTRQSRQHLEGDLAALVRENAAVQAKLRAVSTGGEGGGPAGPVRPGSGGLIWPVNGPIVSAFGMRWGRLHAGVDIAAAAGTAIRAAGSGSVVLLGFTGGYGNYTCIQHGGALSTCYAHQSGYATSMGASVGQGDVIGYVGCTGHCFGDHLHFETRVNGAPVNPAGYL
ncbi:MAG TPA: peptidoglycan DD-metalloendopeptidase family protein [Solirubrobacteraceae bacterium]|nr:peptidoglycan DD-metalloendopeptidase family protein [Solirubrobacteraceae bacterium]